MPGEGRAKGRPVVDCRVHTTSCQVSFPSLGFTDHTTGLLSLPSWSRCGGSGSLQRALYTVKGSKMVSCFITSPRQVCHS